MFVHAMSLNDQGNTYKASLITYQWIEALEQNDISIISLEDDASTNQAIGFSFEFYQAKYNQVAVSSNGFISFDTENRENGTNTSFSIPSAGGINNYVAGWQTDLDPSKGGKITKYTYGIAPNRIFIIRFDDVEEFGNSKKISFQYQLHEATNNVEVHYKSIAGEMDSLTLGIENIDGTDGIEFYHGSVLDFVNEHPTETFAVRYEKSKLQLTYVNTTTSEAMTDLVIWAVLNEAPNATVIIPIMSDDTTEGTTDVHTISFAPHNWNIPQRIIVTGVNDNDIDGDTSYNIVLGESLSNDPDFSGLTRNVSLLNIDNEIPGVFLADFTSTTLTEGDSYQFMVSLNTIPTENVIFTRSEDGDDQVERFIMEPAEIIFTAANATIPQLVTINYLEDDNAFITKNNDILFEAVSRDINYNNSVLTTVLTKNNDIAGIIVEPTSLVSFESGEGFEINVRLATQPIGEITVHIGDLDDLGYVLLNGEGGATVTFDSTNWDQIQMITVSGVDNEETNSEQPYQLIVEVEAGFDLDVAYTRLASRRLDFIHDDNDAFEVVLSTVDGLMVNEDGTSISVDLSLNNAPTEDVVITVMLESGEDEVEVSTSTYTFTASNWDSLQTLVLSGVEDYIIDGNQEVIVKLLTASVDNNYNGFSKSFSVVNADNDVASIVVDVMSEFYTSELGGTQVLNFMLSTQPQFDVSFKVSDHSGVKSPNSSQI
jgi:hypothetical protein